MACFNITIGRDSQLSVETSLVQDIQSCKVVRVAEELKVKSSMMKSLQVETSRLNQSLDIDCRLVCSLSDLAAWLRVSPDEVQWITDDMGVYFDVMSNVDWVVVIEETQHK